MCYPEADEFYEAFSAASVEFKKVLNEIILYNQDYNEKYIEVYNSVGAIDGKVFIYLQRRSNKVLKIQINHNIDVSNYNKGIVTIHAEDPELQEQLEALPCVAEMRKNIKECREIIHSDQVLVKLKYNI